MTSTSQSFSGQPLPATWLGSMNTICVDAVHATSLLVLAIEDGEVKREYTLVVSSRRRLSLI